MTFVESDPAAAREIAARLAEWGAQAARVEQVDARRFLDRTPAVSFDIVFLDPPFASRLLAEAAARLEQHGWLSEGALIYVERAAEDAAGASAMPGPELPPAWTPLKAKQAGEVGYHLYSRAARADTA